MTVCIMAIACTWFALMLLVSSNTVRISRDEITIVQNKALAQGAMTEAIQKAEQAAQTGTLHLLSTELVNRSVNHGDFNGEMLATWQALADDELTITAQGQSDGGRYVLTGRFILCQLPAGAASRQPLLLIDNTHWAAWLAATSYDYVLKDDHIGAIVLAQDEPLSGNLYCQGHGQPDWTVTVKELTIDGQELYIEGHLYVQGHLQVPRLLVTGDVYLADDSTLACSEMWLGGSLSGKDVPESLIWVDEPRWQQTLVIRQMDNLSEE